MEYQYEVMPSDPERLKKMMEPGPEGPIYMINLLKFKDKAEYEDRRETDLSGKEAYALYGKAVSELLKKYDAEAVFFGDVSFLMLGQVEELWDQVAIARYPSRGHLVKMSTSPEYQKIAVHRTAGLKGQLNIETTSPMRL